MRRPPVVLGMSLVTCLALVVAVLLILFSVNPKASHNQSDIKRAQIEIQTAQVSEHGLICAVVQLIANTYRFRSLTPAGGVEPIRHFLTRLEAQKEILRLAHGFACQNAPGFPPVGLQIKRALHQINEILMHYEPRLREPVSRGISHLSPSRSDKHGSFPPGVSGLSKAGIDESGIPAHLKHQLAPSAPVEAHKRHRKELPTPAGPPAAESPAPEESAAPVGPHATNVVEPVELKAPPIKVEINLTEGLNVEVP